MTHVAHQLCGVHAAGDSAVNADGYHQVGDDARDPLHLLLVGIHIVVGLALVLEIGLTAVGLGLIFNIGADIGVGLVAHRAADRPVVSPDNLLIVDLGADNPLAARGAVAGPVGEGILRGFTHGMVHIHGAADRHADIVRAVQRGQHRHDLGADLVVHLLFQLELQLRGI